MLINDFRIYPRLTVITDVDDSGRAYTLHYVKSIYNLIKCRLDLDLVICEFLHKCTLES
jgi:hypothetical protein